MADLVERAYGFDRSLRDRVVSSLVRDPATGCVGLKLVVDDERIRHKHVKDNLWLALTGGRARSFVITDESARLDEFEVLPGESKLTRYVAGEFMIQDQENLGNTELVFYVTEFGGGSNDLLPVPDSVRPNCSGGVAASTCTT